jgi:apolipoprotein D and lipocalin family protein
MKGARLDSIQRLGLTPMILLLAATASADPGPPATVATVDLERYAGRWFEVARIPNRFQKHCARSTTADYTLRADGTIAVLNRCIEADGSTDEARGVAKVVERDSNSKLKVSFVRFLGVQLFWGDYWIIGLGADYEYAVVGSPDRKYGWILSRTPHLDSEAMDAARATLRAQGYSPDRFEMTPP